MTDMKLDLSDWQAADGSAPANPLPTVISANPQRITIAFADGRSVWIEQESGAIRVHGYLPSDSGVDEPLSMSIHQSTFSVSTDGLDDIVEQVPSPTRATQ